MGNWSDYKRTERQRLAPGDYRVEIVDAQEKISSSGNPMIVVVIKPNGSNIKINHYFVKSTPYYMENMTAFFDAFPEIGDGNFNFLEWVGAVGAARLKEDGNYLKVSWFIAPDKAADLPEWQGKKPERQKVTSLDPVFEDINTDADLPF